MVSEDLCEDLCEGCYTKVYTVAVFVPTNDQGPGGCEGIPDYLCDNCCDLYDRLWQKEW